MDKAEKSYKLIKRSNGDNRTSQISPFVLYGDAYIRKTTALYLLQENFQISSDRLLRVRPIQPSHRFAGMDINDYALSKTVRAGDLCIFRRVDRKNKCLLGRIVQFSYLSGTKRNRQYSSDYVDMTKPSHFSIGVLANWFQGTKTVDRQLTYDADHITFKPLDLVFTPGYISLENYVSKIDDKLLVESELFFSILVAVFTKLLQGWRNKIAFDYVNSYFMLCFNS